MNDAQKFINTLKNEYKEDHIKEQERDRLIEENHLEKQYRVGYHGREIFELLQNADDAYQKSINEGMKPAEELKVDIVFKNNILLVNNSGTFFDKDGIKAIVQGNNSTKSEGYIGNKGTGFRSLLNWASKIKIHSGEYHIEFSKEIAQKIFDEIKDKPQIQKQREKYNNLHIPMLAVPEYINNLETSDITSIEITVDEQKNNDKFSVENQLKEIDINILLFLPNLHQIHILLDNEEITYKKEFTQNDTIILHKITSTSTQTEEFFLFHKNNFEKDIKLAIAIPVNYKEFKSTYLYSYFPLLDTYSPFNCILHATYDLGTNRNNIEATELNEQIIKELLYFLIDIAKSFINKKDFERVYNLLLPIKLPLFNRFQNIDDDYFNCLLHLKMFQSVNNEVFSIKDEPRYIEGNYPKVFIGESFSKLLCPLETEDRKKLIEKLIKNTSIKYSENALLDAINTATENWNIKEQIEVFAWWNKHYKNSLPNLIKTHDNKFININDECYLMVGNFSELQIPNWVNLPALDKDYQKELYQIAESDPNVKHLKEQSKDDISRIISQNKIFPCVQFRYKDTNTIIQTVNSLVDDFDKAVNFVKWLWNNYAENESLFSARFEYKFPCIKEGKKSYKNSSELFLGKDYDNELGEQLFSHSNSAIFPSKEYFNINSNELEDFKSFIMKLGVKKYPVIKLTDLNSISMLSSYNLFYKQTLSKNEGIKWIEAKLFFINNLSTILEHVSTENIIKWIISDNALNNHLNNYYDANREELKYQVMSQRTNFYFYKNKIKNYILEIFNDVKWITIDEKKYSPKEILSNTKINHRFIGFAPVIVTSKHDINIKQNSKDILIIEELAKNINAPLEKVQEILNIFSFKENVTDLSSDKFYEILLKLPNINEHQGKNLFKTISNIIEQPGFNKVFEHSTNKDEFFQNGKILVKYKGKELFYPAKESFLPSSTIIDKKNYPIVAKGERTSNSNFIPIFNCQRYEKNYKVDFDNIIISEADEDFQKYFYEFKKYAKAFNQRNSNIAKNNDKLKITLAKYIPVLENDIKIYIEDEYAYINDSSTNWFIKVTTTKINVVKLGSIIKDIYEHIANTPGFDGSKLRELFNADNKEHRENLIEDEFGSLDIINDRDYAGAIETIFINTIKNINPLYNIYTINLDFYNFIEENFENSEKIIHILSELNVDIDTFSEKGFTYPINLIPYYKNQLKRLIINTETNYKNILYSQALQNEDLQKTYFTDINTFKKYTGENRIKNTAYLCIQDILKEEFTNWTEEITSINAEQAYQDNYSKMNPENEFADEIANSGNVQLMIYFSKEAEFLSWKEKRKQEEVKKIEIVPQIKNNIIPSQKEIQYSEHKVYSNKPKQEYIKNSSFNYKQDEKRRQHQKQQGNDGELYIYNLLCKEYDKENVFPRSEAFVDLGILKAGQAQSDYYDLSYRDKNNEIYYVEVKTGHDNTFFISPTELQFAKEHSDNYKIYYVFDVNTNSPKYHIIDNKFWENEKYQCKEIIERIEVKF